MKKLILALLAIIGLLTIVLLFKTVQFTSKQREILPANLSEIDKKAVAIRLSGAVKLKTISSQNTSEFDPAPFLQLHQYLEKSFPQTHKTLEKTVINQCSLLYKWQGHNTAQKPIILMAHLDVVPVEPGTEGKWLQPPFSGAITEGGIWGRGTLDDKSNVLAQLEAIESLIKIGFRPERTVYLAFGHDEEVLGKQGAGKIAEHLKEQGIQAIFTLDEGMMIVDEKLSPAKKKTGIIGIAEKGYVTLKVTAKQQGGHSSLPPEKLTLVTLAQAINKLAANQPAASLTGAAEEMFEYLGPEMPFIQKMLFANRWLFDPLILAILEKQKTTNAMIRTTTAPTIIQGGIKENVLPSQAHVIVNFRILPGETQQTVLAHAKRVIDDPAIEIEFHGDAGSNPARVSNSASEAFALIGQTIQEVFPGTLITPGLLLAATDSKYYQEIADNNYRFSPFTLGAEDLHKIHGTDERIGVADYVKMIQFYVQLLRNATGGAEFFKI